MRKLLGDPRAEFAWLRTSGVRPERNEIKRAQAHANVDLVSAGADAVNDVLQKSRAVLEGATELSRSRVRAEEFMQQITVATLNVDEVSPAIRREPRRAGILFDQSLDIRIAHHDVVAIDPKFAIQDRVSIGDARFQLLCLVRPARPARVRQLEADDDLVSSAIAQPGF